METKISKIFASCLVGCAICATTGCSDFSDYNDAPADQLTAGNQTLWQNITQNQQLRGFAELVKRTGFDAELANTRSYTVWAPLDGTYDINAYKELDDSTLLQQFVKGHIAQYGHVASGEVDERIHMLNEKSFAFKGNGNYTFGGVSVATPNQPSNNGMMHILNGAAPFLYNLYEYLLSNPQDTLLRNYFKKYEVTTLDTRNSVKGPVIDGLQTYIDSVMVTSNSLIGTVNARLSNEDSTYTFLLPNDKAYTDLYNKIKPYYNFINTTTVQDIAQFTKANDTKEKSVTVDANYLSDSLTCRAILRNLAFSNNNEYNKWMVNNGEFTDTMQSTTLTKFSNPREILSHTVEKRTMSNGFAHIMDTLAIYPWESYLPELRFSPMYWAYTAESSKRFNFSSRVINVNDPNGIVFGPDVTEFNYLWIYPTGEYVKPEIYIELNGVMSATYKFYCVFLPSAKLSSDDRPNSLNFQLSYCGANGKPATYSFSKKFLDSGAAADENPKSVNINTAFNNDPLKTDTVYLGQFTFPVAYNGLGTNNDTYSPNLHISCPVSVFNKTQMATYTRDVRIAAILLKPVELVEFEENQK
ncbi:MAG: fasciclin domain-containing protein [Prevotella sp.]|nr:fasciclin domain-containing protein [Prevotella sp.]MBR0275645.1 fasciclin domain-containing protein [Prevotella sp.]